MLDISTWQIVLGTALTALTVGGILARRWGPKLKHARSRFISGWAQLFGTEEIRHKVTGQVLVPAQPGVGVQVDRLNTAVLKLVELHGQTAELQATAVATLATLTDHGLRVEKLEQTTTDHALRVKKLEEAAVERVVSKAESTAAWRAMEAATKATPDLDGGVVE